MGIGDGWAGGHRVYTPCVIIKPDMVEIADSARVDSFCKLEGGLGLHIGEFVHIASFSHINVGGGKTIFEDHSGCSSGVKVLSGSPDWSLLHISAAEPSEFKHKRLYITRICSYAVVFAGAIICPGVEIGEGAVVKPGAVVFDNVAPYDIVAGNPAIVVGKRKIGRASS